MVPSVAGITRWDREVCQDAASTAGPQLRPMLGPNAPGSLEAMRHESIARHQPEAQPEPTPTMTPTTVDLVVPVYNEESGLAASIEALLAADTGRATELTIIIADNASTDSTPVIGAALAAAHPTVEYVRLNRKGRGRALSQVWQASDADVVAYTDVDLATDITVLDPMVEVIRSGLADVAIASRLLPGLAISRGIHREIISRCYNRLLRLSLGVGFSEAQCGSNPLPAKPPRELLPQGGFDALSAKAAKDLLPQVEDAEWFFDTELLARAEWAGLRIHEFGTDWTDDPDSSVDVVDTAWMDIKGIVRLRTSGRARGGGEVPAPNTGAQILHFVDVGIISTLLYAVLFLFAVQVVSPTVANIAALLISTVINTAAHRTHTFGMRAPHHRFVSQAKGLAAFALCFAFTSAGLSLASGFTGE